MAFCSVVVLFGMGCSSESCLMFGVLCADDFIDLVWHRRFVREFRFVWVRCFVRRFVQEGSDVVFGVLFFGVLFDSMID